MRQIAASTELGKPLQFKLAISEAIIMKMTRRDGLVMVGTMTGFFLLGSLASLLYPRLKQELQPAPTHAIVLNADPACNPVGKTCLAQDAALTVTLGLGDRIQPLTAFPVQVDLGGEAASKAEKVTVSFAMQGMDMGFNRFDLRRQVDQTWRGQAILPVCSAGRRDWRATVAVIGKTPYVGEFHLLTDF
ncbi:MAG: hypothetical protein KDJ28_03565 [Candidatus Competibacteraceae bacterium]|nr:hypothetical protein [Candidatus Competibacteraceae bacterium]